MKNAIAQLARARSIEAEYKAKIDQSTAELKKTGVWRYLEQQREYLKVAQDDVAYAETDARKAAMKVFTETDDRTPHPAIKVKDFTVLEYDDGEALDYARVYVPRAVKLNKRKFEQAAKVLEPDFVTIRQEPRATIARDLSEYLPKD